MMTSLWRHL